MTLDRLLPSRRALRTCLLPLPLLFLLGSPTDEAGLVVHLGEPAVVQAGEQAAALAVLGADAHVDGTVLNTLVVVGGRADVFGAVHGDVVVVDGELALGPGALVTGDVALFGSTVSGADETTVVGTVTHDPAFEVGRAAALFWWMSSTLALVALALGVVALVGLRPRAVEAGVSRAGGAALVGFAVAVAAPLAAGLAFMTGIGLGVGLLILAALPGLFLAGYVVAGLSLGAALLDRSRPRWGARPWAPYAAAALGVVALQALWAVPFLGLASALAAVAGVGALALGVLGARRQTEARWGARPAIPPSLSVS